MTIVSMRSRRAQPQQLFLIEPPSVTKRDGLGETGSKKLATDCTDLLSV